MAPIIKLLIFSFIATGIIAVGLILCKRFVKTQKAKDLIYLIASILVVVIHYSSVFYHGFVDKVWELEDNMWLPVYPCNIIMWLNLALAFMNKQCKGFKLIAPFVFLGGTMCTMVGYFANVNFLNNPDFLDFDILKGLLSHVVVAFACLYLGVMGYVEIRAIPAIVSCACGCLLFLACGGFTILICHLVDIEPANTMFLLEPPIESMPYMSVWILMIGGLLVLFGGLTLYERFFIPKEERWYHKCFHN